jgi:hypothetical protein
MNVVLGQVGRMTGCLGAQAWLSPGACHAEPVPSARSHSPAAVARLRPMILLAAILVLIQAGIGMVVNLYVTVPAHHPGARPSNFLTGSASSVGWAISHGALALAIHATLGLAVIVVAIWVAVRAAMLRQRAVAAWLILAALLTIGAGFNGASFLDFNKNFSSLIMALLAFAALLCYAVGIYLAPAAD